MKYYPGVRALLTPLFVAGYLMAPAVVAAAGTADSAEITQLLADAKAESMQLRYDSSVMEAFTKSQLSWQTYAAQIEMVKEHVNKTGELLAKLNDRKAEGSAWQQTAIKRIEPLLRELAANTGATIRHLNENQFKFKGQFAPLKDYVRANYELAVDLEALIRDFVDYGQAKEKFENLGQQLEVS